MAVVPSQADAAANSIVVRVPLPQSVPQKQPAAATPTQQPQPAQNPSKNLEDSAQQHPAAFILPYLPTAVDKVRYSAFSNDQFEGDQDHLDLLEALNASAKDWHVGPRDVAHVDYDPKLLAQYADFLERRGDPRRHVVKSYLRLVRSDRRPHELVRDTMRGDVRDLNVFGGDHDHDLLSLPDGRLVAHLDQELPGRDEKGFRRAVKFIGEVTPAEAADIVAQYPAGTWGRKDGEKFLRQHAKRHLQEPPKQYAARKAPAAGIVHRGIFYPGGAFLPDMPSGGGGVGGGSPAVPASVSNRTKILRQLKVLLRAKRK